MQISIPNRSLRIHPSPHGVVGIFHSQDVFTSDSSSFSTTVSVAAIVALDSTDSFDLAVGSVSANVHFSSKASSAVLNCIIF